MEKEKRKSIITISVVVGALLLVFVGLIIMAVRNRTNVSARKTLRYEMARMVDKREKMDCTISWKTEDYMEYVAGGSVPNPKEQSVTFAAEKDWTKIYLSRYDRSNSMYAFYATEDKAYVWSPIPDLLKANAIYQREAEMRRVESVILKRDFFDDKYSNIGTYLDNLIREAPAGAEIICRDGGTAGYSQSKSIESWYDATKEEK